MLRINFYISGHGFGHATRSAQLISALLASSPTTHITIITTAPTHLFPTSPRLSFITQSVDSFIIQPQPYTIDAASSFANLRSFLQQASAPEWRVKTSVIIDSTKCNLILADAPYPLAWAGAKERGIKSVLVSNFTFDAIFAKLLTYLPEGEGQRELVEQIKILYATYDYVVKLPGYIDFPFVEEYWSEEDREVRVTDAPLVFRPPRLGREDVLGNLGVPVGLRGNKVLLVQFGGQIVGGEGVLKVPKLPDGWICLSSTPVADKRFFTFPKDVYSPDLVVAADVVLGKIGTCITFVDQTNSVRLWNGLGVRRHEQSTCVCPASHVC